MEVVVAVWEKINSGGPAVIFILVLVIWWLNEDRKTLLAKIDKLQGQKDEIHDRTINAANHATGAIEDLRDLLYRGAEKGK